MNRVENTFGNVKVVENINYQWGVTDLDGNIIVPFGKYDWIESFDENLGLARVKIGKESNAVADNHNKWGIINMEGEEILPVEYDNIWRFVGKGLTYTNVTKDGITSRHYFEQNEDLSDVTYDDLSYPYNEPGWGRYDEYGGYNGYDDYTIDSAFDGDPEATWNID